MGILDSIESALQQVNAGNPGNAGNMPAAISTALANTNLGGLSGILGQLEQGGLGKEVQSWLGSGTNLPVTADQLRSALSDQHVQQIARQLGLPVDSAMQLLAQHLPATVDQASPTGVLPANA
jgi:uncharacterized protein YidB (DUF937 family)